MKRKRLGEMLMEKGLLSQVQLDHALDRQKQYGGRIGSNLVKAGIISEADLMRFLAVQTGVREINLARFKPDPKIMKKVPKKIALKYNILPVGMRDKSTLVLACVDPTDLNMIDEIGFITGNRIQPVVSSYTSILTALNHYYSAVPLADGTPVHGATASVGISDSAGGAHEAQGDPDLIIFGEQTLDGLSPTEMQAPDMPRPLDNPTPASVSPHAKPAARAFSEEENPEEFTLDFTHSFPPLTNVGSAAAPAENAIKSTMDQRMRAVVNVLVRKGIISKGEIQAELARLRNLGKI